MVGVAALSQKVRQVGQLPTRRFLRVPNNQAVRGIGVCGVVNYIEAGRAEVAHAQHTHFERWASGECISFGFFFGRQPCK